MGSKYAFALTAASISGILNIDAELESREAELRNGRWIN